MPRHKGEDPGKFTIRSLVVPTAVRVEARWDRRQPYAAAINHLRIHDAPLDTKTANRAARTCAALAISVTDAYVATPNSDVLTRKNRNNERRLSDRAQQHGLRDRATGQRST